MSTQFIYSKDVHRNTELPSKIYNFNFQLATDKQIYQLCLKMLKKFLNNAITKTKEKSELERQPSKEKSNHFGDQNDFEEIFDKVKTDTEYFLSFQNKINITYSF